MTMSNPAHDMREAAARVARDYKRDDPDRLCCMGRNENIARAIEALPLPEPPAPSNGQWKLVPIEPTEEMTEAGTDAFWTAWDAALQENRERRKDPTFQGRAGCQFIPQVWRAMIAAAPEPPAMDFDAKAREITALLMRELSAAPSYWPRSANKVIAAALREAARSTTKEEREA